MNRGAVTSLLALAALVAAGTASGRAVPGPALRAPVGSTLTISGKTGSGPGEHRRAVGTVVVDARWGAGRWFVLKTTATDASGGYRFTVSLWRRGLLAVRIVTPDHHPRRYLLRIV